MAYGYKGKGILIHTLTDGNGLPLSNSTTAANGSERKQVIPLLNSVLVKTNCPGRPRKRVKVLAADKGYDSKDLRAAWCVNVVLDRSCRSEPAKLREIEVDQ
ncbi:transposase [Chlorogloea sp. CCALA 695]|uniref:transposase n=1 Tax=Chlorogloea sp. CCALA 695 TaxID=2107693 RepID=UPI0018ED2AA3|nr:transposase [Chlorogloea sp. CCALA 695]